MRIGLNAHRLVGQRLGVGRYIEYLLRYWSGMLTATEEIEIFLRRPLDARERAHLRLASGVRETVLGRDIPGVAWENLWLWRAARRADVLFCPAYTAPVLYRGALVVATHSLDEVQQSTRPWWYRQVYGGLHRDSARRADAVIVAADTTKRHLAHHWRIPEERMVVVRQGADDCFRPMNDPAALAAVRRRYFDRDRPFVLFVGKASLRRNVPLLVRAFAAARREHGLPHGLLLFGPVPAEMELPSLCRELGVERDVVQTDGHVADHAELVPIYNAADVFVHPSEYEGWSMTTVEAMACGTAVVAADRGGLGEAARGHAHMLDSPCVESIADALGRVLGDDEYRADLRRRAFARGDALRWRDASRQTLDVLRAVAS